MAIVGSAEVVVRAITTKVKGDIEKAFRDARASVASEGKSASDDFVRGFKSNFSDGMSSAISDGIGKSSAESDMENAGKRHGGAFNSGMLDELGNLDIGSTLGDALDGASSDVDKSVTRTAREASQSFESEMGSGGRRGGSAFSKGFENSDFAKGAMKASSAFTQLIGMGNLAGPAIAGLVGALSAAASGLFSMASAAGAAAGALGVLPGLAAAAAQGMGAIKLAFSGIGAAVSAGLKPVSPAVANMAAGIATAQRAVSAALKNLAQAREDAGRRMAAAQKGLARAEEDAARSMADARKGLAEAERSADEAMAEARKNLAQAERDANADLIDARQKLADAEREAARSLVDARNKVIEAENNAAKNIATARAKLADVYKAGAQKMVDANRKVADASFSLARAQQTLTDSQNKLNDARETGLEQLQQLAFSAEDAALSEERAGLTLEDAYTNLQKVQDLPPDDRGRREAELAFKEAELGYREAKDRAADVQKEEAKASAAGVEGTSAVVDAKNEQTDAENNLADAQQALADAQVERDKVAVQNAQDVADAQQAIDDARLEGAKSIAAAQQDLDDQVYENKRKLADAEANLEKVKYNNAKRIAEARQNLAKTAYDNEKKIADARANVEQTAFDNARRISDARQNIADTARQNARSIADAEQAVTDAQARLAEAHRKSAAAVDVFGAAMKKLSGPAQEFVKYLISLKDEMDALKAAAGQDLFPKLETALRGLVANVFPILEKQLRVTGSLLGDAALGFSNVFDPKSGLKGNRLNEVMKDNNETLAVFFKRGKDGENTVSQLTRLLLRLLVAVHPVTMIFANWVKTLIDTAEQGTRTGEQMGKLTEFFNKAGRRAALLGDIFKNVFHILGDLAKAADPAGVGLLNSFEDATKALHKFLSTDKQQKKLRQFFHDVANNMRAMGDLINAVGQEFLGLGDNKGVGKLARSLIPAVHIMGDIGDRLASASPALGGFATEIAKLIKRLTQTSQINLFIHVLTQIVHTINTVMTWLGKAANKFDTFFEKLTGISNVTGKIGKIALEFFAIHRAIAFALVPIAFIFKALAGGPIKVYAQFKKLIKVFGMFRNGDWSKGFRALIGGSDKTILALEKQMSTDKKKIASLDGVTAAADRAAGALERMKIAGEPGVGASTSPIKAPAAAAAAPLASVAPAAAGAGEMAAAEAGAVSAGGKFSKLGGIMGKLVKGPFKLLGGGLKLIGKAVYGVLGPVGLFIAAGVLLFIFFKALYKHSAAFRTFADGIRDKLKELGDWFHNIMETVIWPALDAFVVKIGDVAAVVIPWLGDMFKKIGGFISTYFVPVWNNVLLPVFGFLVDVVKTSIGFVIDHFDGFKDAIGNAIGFIVNFVKDHWGLLLAIFLGPMGAIIALIIKNFGLIKDVIGAAIGFIAPLFVGVFDGIKFAVTNIFIPYWGMVWKAIQFLWGIAQPIFGFLVDAVGKLFDGIKFYINNVFLPFWGLVWKGIQGLWSIAKPIFGFLVDAVGVLFEGIKFYVNNVFIPVWGLIWEGIQKLWGIAKVIFSLLLAAFKVVGDGISWVWSHLIMPAFDLIKAGIGVLWDTVKFYVDLIKAAWNIIGDGIGWVWEHVIKPAFDLFMAGVGFLWEAIKTDVDLIKNAWDTVSTKISDVFQWIKDSFDKFKIELGILWAKISSVIDTIKDKFQEMVDKVVDVIEKQVMEAFDFYKQIFTDLWDKTNEIIDWIKDKFDDLKKKIQEVISTFIDREITGFKRMLGLLQDKAREVIDFIKQKFEELKNKITEMIDNFIRPKIQSLKDKFDELWEKVKKTINDARDKVVDLWETIKAQVDTNIRPKIDDLKAKFDEFWEKVKATINDARDKIVDLWVTVKNQIDLNIMPKIEDLKTKFGELQTKVGTVIGACKTAIEALPGYITGILEDVGTAVGKVADKFGAIGRKVSEVFEGLKGFAVKGINQFIDFINDKLIANVNKVTSKFGLKIEPIDNIKAAEGGRVSGDGRDASGRVQGHGGTRQDNIPYLLSAGEYVVRGQAVRSIGEQNLNYMNRYGRAPTGMRMGIGDTLENAAASAGGFARGLPHISLHIPDSIEGMYEQGVGKLLKSIVKGAEKFMGAAGLKRGNTMEGMFYGIMDKLAEKAGEWGQEKQDAEMKRRAAAAAAAANSGGGSGPAAIWRALKSVGFSDIHASGILGNIATESAHTFDPHVIQSAPPYERGTPAQAGHRGYGLVQWTPGTKLIPMLHGRAPTIDNEISVLKEQLSGNESSAGRALAGTSTPESAAAVFLREYERAADLVQPQRGRDARAFYNRFRGTTGAGQGGSDSGGGGGVDDGAWGQPLPYRAFITQWPNSGHSPTWAVDLRARTPQPVLSVHSGTVIFSGSTAAGTSYGNYMKVAHPDGTTSLYAHLSERLKSAGAHVLRGTRIGTSGATGGAQGPHLHFELMRGPDTYRKMLARGVRLAEGGVVPATPGGILAMIGEAGKNERVEPLNRDGMSKRDEHLLKLLAESAGGGGGGHTTVNVYPSPGMNEIELAELVSRRIAWRRRPGV